STYLLIQYSIPLHTLECGGLTPLSYFGDSTPLFLSPYDYHEGSSARQPRCGGVSPPEQSGVEPPHSKV
ncbi:MAG TPA: hypothetical protein VMS31_15285, partial [Pyrinomonadaceae bacterium]|nr:hypothetical protein [Pyrinomonadaceae bacterium]